MKCAICGLAEAEAEAEAEFEHKSKDGATVYEKHNLCWDCLNQRMTSLMGGKRKPGMRQLRAHDTPEKREFEREFERGRED